MDVHLPPQDPDLNSFEYLELGLLDHIYPKELRSRS